MDKELSAVLEKARKISIEEFPIPSVEKEGILLRVEAVGVCGSDVERYRGTKFGGSFKTPFPIIMGHEVVGNVAAANTRNLEKYDLEIGDRIVVEPYILCCECNYCLTGYYQLCKNMRCYGINISCNEPPHLWGAYGQYMYVAPNSRIHKISNDVSKEAACLSSIIGNGIRWVCVKGKVHPGDSVIIIGPGTQGLASVLVADHVGASKICLIGTSKDRKRLEIGKSLGATECIVIEDEDIIERVREITENEFADVVLCCVGSPKAIEMSLNLVKPLGTLVLVGLTGNEKSNLLTDKIVTNEIQVLGGLGQSWSVEAAIKLLESNKYPIKKIVTHSFKLKDVDKALRTSAYEITGEEPIKSIIIPD